MSIPDFPSFRRGLRQEMLQSTAYSLRPPNLTVQFSGDQRFQRPSFTPRGSTFPFPPPTLPRPRLPPMEMTPRLPMSEDWHNTTRRLNVEFGNLPPNGSGVRRNDAIGAGVGQNVADDNDVERENENGVDSVTMHGSEASHEPSEHASARVGSMDRVLDAMTQLLQQNATLLQNQAAAIPPRSFHVMPDLTKSIGDFTGRETPVEAKRWIQQVESSAFIHAWPEAFLYETATIHLKNAARSWFLSKNNSFTSWEDFKCAFIATFVPQVNKSQMWDNLKNRRQRENECLQDYFYEKVRLCNTLELNFDETREQIATGLLNRDLAVHALGMEFDSVEKLFHGLLRFDRTIKNFDTSRNRKAKDVPANKNKKTTETAPSESESSEKKSSSSKSSERKCYNCLKTGHFSNKCPEPPKNKECRRCGETGHYAKNCAKPLPMDKGEVNIVSASGSVKTEHELGSVGCTGAPENRLAKYLKTIKINGLTMQSMIDPGSSDCTIKATAVLCHGLEVIRLPSVLGGFGKQDANNLVTSCGVVRVSVEVDEVEARDVLFRIVPDDVQSTDVLIGRTFTELDHIVYIKVDNKLIFIEKATFELSKVLPELNKKKIERPAVSRDNTLPPAAVNLVEVKFEGTKMSLPLANLDSRSRSLREGEIIDSSVMRIERAAPLRQRETAIEDSEINVDDTVSNTQRRQLRGLLEEYRDCIAQNIHEIGRTSLLEMDIQEKPGSVPVSVKPYRNNRKERESIKEIVSEWKDAGIVRETSSPYASPVLLVTKKNGEKRLVVDYRKLNAQTERIHYPLPNIDEYLEVVSGAKIFATLDLAHGYLQLPLSKEACAKTAFITPDETGEFTRTMFGLMNAPFYFSKMMEMALGPLRNKFVLFYLDDVLVLARDWEELMDRLRAVLEALRAAGLTLKLAKCHFGKRKVEYLGFVVSEAGIEPGPVKVEAIAKFPVPSNVHEIRRFIGMASFFRRFVPKFSSIVAPLTELTRKEVEFHWGEKEQAAYEEVKRLLTSKPVLGIFNPRSPRTELHTDASAAGLGAILLQENEKKELHPIFAISRQTSEAERNYHSSKLELMAIVWAVERLRMFLISIKFTIVTDCQALVYLNANKTTNPQVARWTATLSEYDFEIKHKKGTQMTHVDALSRAPIEEPVTEELLERSQVFQVSLREEEILLYQREDDMLKRKIDILSKDRSACSKKELDAVQDYRLRDGILYRSIVRDGKEIELYVVPSMMRKALVIKYHDLSSHFGADKTFAKMQAYYYFPRMRTYIKRHIAQCLECIMSKKTTGARAGELRPIPPGERPFSVVHVDHVGPFVTSTRGSKYVLGLIDTLTKYVIFEPVKNTSAVTTVKKLEKFVNQFGAPTRIISDRGSCFTSKKFEEFCTKHGIKHTLNSSRHPQANGLIERMNRTLLPPMIIRTEQGLRLNWDDEVKDIERDVNSSVSKSTGKTPFESLYGYQPRFSDGRMREITENCEVYRNPVDVQEKIRAKINESQMLNKEYYDKRRNKSVNFSSGDIVYVKVDHVSTGESAKLQPRYRGPFVVTKSLTNDTYIITRIAGGRKMHRPLTAHVSQLKLWRGRDKYSATEEKLDDNDELCGNNVVCDNDELCDNNVICDNDENNVTDVSGANDEFRETEDHSINDDETLVETIQTRKTSGNSAQKEIVRPQRQRRPPAYLRDYVEI